MQVLLDGLLVMGTVIYMTVIIFYLENVGFIKAFRWYSWQFWKSFGFFKGFRVGQLPEVVSTLFLLLFGLVSVAAVPPFISEMVGLETLMSQILFLLLLVLLEIWMHMWWEKRLDFRVLDSPNLKVMLVTCGTALMLFHARNGGEVELPNVVIRFEAWEPFLFLLHFACLGVLAYINIVHTSRQFKIEQERAENAAFERYTSELEVSYEALRVVKHDYANIMTSLKLFIDEGDMVGLRRYYAEEFAEFSNSISASHELVDQLQRIKVKELKSILLYKLNLAVEAGLTVSVEVKFTVGNVSVPKVKLCQIIGIFLDNAIEASLDSSEKILSLAVIGSETKTVFMFENSWTRSAMPVKRFFEKGFSTKGEGRGLGLSTVEALVEAYEALELDTEVGESRFTQILTIKEVV